jgi:asparagine N-glycosylation enzyme membrane subunit Stt3
MRSLRGLLVLLILLATTGFIIGVAIERSSAEEPHTVEPVAHEEGGHEEGEATNEGQATDEGSEAPSEGNSSETVLGLNVESTPLVVTAVLFSLVLAGAAWAWPRSRPLLVIVIAAMLAFAVLDIAEVVHQLDTSRAGLAILAAIVAALHLAAAGTSGAMLRTSEA